jgi:hypothetical protein
MTEWIHVEDSLPEHNQKVKCKGSFPFEVTGFFHKYAHYLGYSFFSRNEESKNIIEIYGVNHWMPLPKEPNE